MLFRRVTQLDDAGQSIKELPKKNTEPEEPSDDLRTLWLNKDDTQGIKEIEANPADFHRVLLLSHPPMPSNGQIQMHAEVNFADEMKIVLECRNLRWTVQGYFKQSPHI